MSDQDRLTLRSCCASVIHAEMPVSGEGIPDPRGLQLWIDLPKQYKMIDPSYQELDPEKYITAFRTRRA